MPKHIRPKSSLTKKKDFSSESSKRRYEHCESEGTQVATRRKLLLVSLAMALFYLSAYAVHAAELQLAGIKLGTSAMTIIHKFGNPMDISIGESAEQYVAAPPSVSGASSGLMPGAFPGAMPSDLSGMPGGGPSSSGATGGLPVIAKKGPPEVTWSYRFPKNRSIDFIINPDGRIMQIQVFGADWSTIHTAKGIVLGSSTYKDVLAKYGFPEEHDRTGIELITRYTKKDRVIFTLVGQTVVGITIGLMN
jgi:hypothetical protein